MGGKESDTIGDIGEVDDRATGTARVDKYIYEKCIASAATTATKPDLLEVLLQGVDIIP